MQLTAKTEELGRSTAKMFREIDKAKEKTYSDAEKRFMERMEAREYNYEQKMKQFE